MTVEPKDVRMAIRRRVHARLLVVQDRLCEQEDRQVSLSETIAVLLDRAGEREDQGA